MATDPQPVSPAPAPRRRGCGKPVLVLLLLALVAAGIVALWAWITLSWDYADGTEPAPSHLATGERRRLNNGCEFTARALSRGAPRHV